MKLEKIFTENKKKIKKDVTDSESTVFTENTSDTTSSENTESSNTSISNKDNIECNEIDIFGLMLKEMMGNIYLIKLSLNKFH